MYGHLQIMLQKYVREDSTFSAKHGLISKMLDIMYQQRARLKIIPGKHHKIHESKCVLYSCAISWHIYTNYAQCETNLEASFRYVQVGTDKSASSFRRFTA
jgi:hypothetical protein